MVLPDYHMHTRLSPDCKATHEEMAQAALDRGLTHICFTDHADFGHPNKVFDRAPDSVEMDKALEDVRSKFTGLNIAKGLEVGWIEATQEKSAQLVSSMDLDFVLLSVHVVDGADCYNKEFAEGKTKQEAYESYLNELLCCVSSPLNDYDCAGHIGYPAKCGHYRNSDMKYADYSGPLDDILREIIKMGKGIEINTSSLDRVKHCMPSLRTAGRFAALGGEIITLGSDAHLPQSVGYGIKPLLQGLKRNGVRNICTFEKRKPIFHKI